MARYGLIVGVAKYKSPLGNLSKTESDAKAVNDLLKQHGDFEDIQVLTGEVTAKQLEDALGRLLLERADRNEALIYFSGHAVVVKGNFNKKRGYFALSNTGLKTSNGEITGIENGIALDDLSGLIGEAKLSNLVVLLDCCHSETLLEESHGFLERAIVNQAFAELKQDYFLVSACRKFEEAYAMKSESYSIFTGTMLRGLARERANDRGVVDASTMFGYVAEQLRGTGQEAVSFGYGRALRIVDYRSSINSLNLFSQNNPSRNIKNISKSVIHWSLILLACISGFGVFQLVNTNNKNRSSYCPNNIKISDQIITIGIADFGKQNNQTNNIETDIELELRNKLQYPFVRICRIKSTVTSPLEAKNLSEDWSDILGKNGLIIWGNETRIGIVMLNNTYTSPQPLTIDSNINTFYIAKLVMLTTSYHLIRLVKDENEKLNIINTSLLFIEKDRIKLENIFPQELSKIYYRTGQLLTSINSLDNSCDKVVEKCQEAIQAFQNVIRVDPENYEAIYLVGILAQNLKRYDLALQKYNQLISSSTQKRLLESLTRRAEILLEQKNYVDVEKDLARLSNSYPTQGRIAKIQIRIDREYQIEKIYEDLDYLAKVKLEEENYLDIGNIYFRLRRFDKHRNYFEEKLLCKIDLLKLEKILENYNQSELQADVKEFSKKLKSKKQVCP